MKYFANISNGKINGITQINNNRFNDSNNFQVEITEEIYKDILNGNIYTYKNNTIIKDEIETKNKEIDKLKKTIKNEILEEYPFYKQIDIILNVNNYNDNDFSHMKNFIEEKIKKYKTIKNEINNK